MRFYPSLLPEVSETDPVSTTTPEKNADLYLLEMSERFAASVPPHEFSIAEIQGFLLTCKHDPQRAVEEIRLWVENEKTEREARLKREAERKETILGRRRLREDKHHRDPKDNDAVKTAVINGSALLNVPVPAA